MQQTAVITPRFAPTWESLQQYRVPEWFRDAKFGIFIHWGLASVPAFNNEWYARNMYQQGSPEFAHHVARYGPQTTFGYKDFIPQFTAARFDARVWADLFKQAGAKYVVPVAEHHDGFALYDCSFSPWTAVKMGPRRDLLGELAAAVREAGLIFGLSSHRAEHYWFFDGGRAFRSDVHDPRWAEFYGAAQPQASDPDPGFLADWLRRTRELVRKYEPQLIYFDWWIKQPCFAPYLRQFAADYYNQPLAREQGVVITYKEDAFPEGAAVFDVERGHLAGLRDLAWQTDTAVGKGSWCYVENQAYKTADSLIGDLVDIVSKNGNLLLNVGPRPDGTLPSADQAILRQIGQWLATNGEAIYGTRPWHIFGEGPTEIQEGQWTENQRPPWTSADIRFTTKGNTLYATCLGWPGSQLTIRALNSTSSIPADHVAQIDLLGSAHALSWSQDSTGLTIELPPEPAHSAAYTFKVTLS